MSVIRLDNVSKYYVGNNEIALGLRKINLEFDLGELVAVTGESGSGKSTLLNVLSGSDSYEEGEMYIYGQPTSYFDEADWESYRRENIGFIYQGYNLIDSYTVFENVNIALVVKGALEDNRERVMKYLDKVGLSKLADKKATHLSSGQKQRLAIARALAKETDVLVADEPTGNLDSENSAQVMKLLHSLSTDKLVIVVTHNYDEIAPYATRKIRMYDGEVAEDLELAEKNLSGRPLSDKSKSDNAKDKNAKEEIQKQKKAMVKRITSLNRRSRPVTFAFMMAFMIASAIAFYILLGTVFSNMDSTTSKTFDSAKFPNKDITRLMVMKVDGSKFTDEDMEEIANINHIAYLERYDVLSDSFYMLKEHKDYKFYYNVRKGMSDDPSYKKPVAVNTEHFMRSVSGLTQKDLKAGKMPEGLYDIVMYSEDDGILGSELTIYVGNKLNWGSDIAELTFTVTGILKKKTEQIYFSEEFGSMMEVKPKDYIKNYIADDGLYKDGDLESSISVRFEEPVSDKPSIIPWVYDEHSELDRYQQQLEYIAVTNASCASNPIFVINEELTGNEIIVSDEFCSRSCTNDQRGKEPYDFGGVCRYFIKSEAAEEKVDKLNDLLRMVITEIDIYSGYLEKGEDDIGTIEAGGRREQEYKAALEKKEREREDLLKQIEEAEKLSYLWDVPLEIQQKTSLSTANVIEVSREFFEEHVGLLQSRQIAVYMTDYVYADDVMADMDKDIYSVASAYRAGAVDYDYDLVGEKAVSMFIAIAAFLMIFFIGVFILGLIMNLSIRDFKILRLLGMERNDINSVNKRSIIENMSIAALTALAVIIILNLTGVEYVVNVAKYYRWQHYLIYIAALGAFLALLNVRNKIRIKNM